MFREPVFGYLQNRRTGFSHFQPPFWQNNRLKLSPVPNKVSLTANGPAEVITQNTEATHCHVLNRFYIYGKKGVNAAHPTSEILVSTPRIIPAFHHMLKFMPQQTAQYKRSWARRKQKQTAHQHALDLLKQEQNVANVLIAYKL